MAEERLIDDDKDRRYKIRVNENGEEELVINPQATEDEREEELGFEVPDFDTDDEEAAVMTPEQLAARQRQREEDELKRSKKVSEYINRALSCLGEEDYSGAIYALNEAGELDPCNGEIYSLKIKAYSRKFTDWSLLEECADAAEGVRAYSSDEQKSGLKAISAPLENRINETRNTVNALNEENESKKSERREGFKAGRKTALIAFAATASPFVVFLILAIVFGTTFMYTREDSLFTVITIVFAVLAFAAFVAMLVALRKVWETCRNVKRNEKNFSTRLGREYEEKRAELEKLTRIYAAFSDVCAEDGEDNDIS